MFIFKKLDLASWHENRLTNHPSWGDSPPVKLTAPNITQANAAVDALSSIREATKDEELEENPLRKAVNQRAMIILEGIETDSTFQSTLGFNELDAGGFKALNGERSLIPDFPHTHGILELSRYTPTDSMPILQAFQEHKPMFILATDDPSYAVRTSRTYWSLPRIIRSYNHHWAEITYEVLSEENMDESHQDNPLNIKPHLLESVIKMAHSHKVKKNKNLQEISESPNAALLYRFKEIIEYLISESYGYNSQLSFCKQDEVAIMAILMGIRNRLSRDYDFIEDGMRKKKKQKKLKELLARLLSNPNVQSSNIVHSWRKNQVALAVGNVIHGRLPGTEKEGLLFGNPHFNANSWNPPDSTN